jgi:hypothetical protein
LLPPDCRASLHGVAGGRMDVRVKVFLVAVCAAGVGLFAYQQVYRATAEYTAPPSTSDASPRPGPAPAIATIGADDNASAAPAPKVAEVSAPNTASAPKAQATPEAEDPPSHKHKKQRKGRNRRDR